MAQPVARASTPPSSIRSVCVFCGSSVGARDGYVEAAKQLGVAIARRGQRLVYGGGSIGLMGEVARSAHANGAKVLGIIPEALVGVELCGSPVDEEKVVKDMHERKAAMQKNCDAFVALPGGFGTMEELLEMITWQQLGYHTKPIGVLDCEGFFDLFLQFLDHMVAEGFVRKEARKIVVHGTTADELLDKLEVYQPPESVISLGNRGAFHSGGSMGP